MLAAAAMMFAAGCSDDTTVPDDGDNNNPPAEDVVPKITFDENDDDPTAVMEGEGGSMTLTFTSAMAWTVDASVTAEWLTVAPVSGNAGRGTLVLTAEAYDGEEPRSTEFAVSSANADGSKKTVRVVLVTQQPANHLIITRKEYTVSAAGGEVEVELQSNFDVDMTMPADAAWIKVQAESRAMTPRTYTFAVEANTGAARSAVIRFASKDGKVEESVTVTQMSEASAEMFVWPNNEANDGITRAFPGAEGGGMYTTGGRGGKVVHVTNLNSSGTGSLRNALSMSGARIIVFDVAGTITLTSELKISSGNVTVAGQTAPGDGICIKGGTVQIDADNVIFRYVRFRLGDESKTLNDGSDATWGRYHENIIFDHCSMSWSVDEVASFYANKNFTMQWCLLAEAMCNSVHGKGGHGYGGIWGGRNASFHHNMLAHNNSRNARIDHPEIYGVNVAADGSVTFKYIPSHRGNVDYRNNVIYNWGDNNTYGGEGGWFNMVGNYYKPGPASKDKKYFLDANGFYSSGGRQYDYPRLYLEGNRHTKYPEFDNDQQAGIYLHDLRAGEDIEKANGNPGTMFLASPLPIMKDDAEVCWTTTHTADKAFDNVRAYAGASLRRDAVDARIVEEARTGTATYMTGSNGSKGGIIDSQKDVGGWPELTATEEELARTLDTDGDGIPDYYEDVFGLDKHNAEDAALHSFDERYSNLEMYFHYLVQDMVAAQVAGGTNTELK